MTLEMSYLAMYGLFLVLLILVQVSISGRQHGLLALFGNRENLISNGIAERAERAVQNSIFAMALIAPSVLMLAYADRSSSSTEFAIQIFLAARIIYAACFIIGITYLRTIAWVIGFLATAYLYLTLV
ncbi:MAG: glycine dehydrogenase [Marinovum sp.]|nr:glycine dehydrogenase [Marinovum sp.]